MHDHHHVKNLIGSLLCLAIVTAGWMHLGETTGKRYFTSALKQAAATYLVVRGVDAVISVIQNSDIQTAPAGVGVTIAVGEVVDPINDLLERFSWVLLLATASLGIQRILMEITGWWGINLFLTLAGVVVIGRIWLRGSTDLKSGWLLRGFLLLLLVRFALPVMAVANQSLYRHWFATEIDQRTQQLEVMGADVRTAVETTTAGDASAPSMWDRFKAAAGSAEALKATLNRIRDTISHMVDRILDLVAVFLLQTVVLPLIFLWLLLQCLRLPLPHRG